MDLLTHTEYFLDACHRGAKFLFILTTAGAVSLYLLSLDQDNSVALHIYRLSTLFLLTYPVTRFVGLSLASYIETKIKESNATK